MGRAQEDSVIGLELSEITTGRLEPLVDLLADLLFRERTEAIRSAEGQA